ncbi:MAG: response regulator [Betaproteobacteria bacterium]|nr:response regulator [Betaproteobacteria bacterium]
MSAFLLVDDDRTFARVLARSLARRGLEVRVAHDVEGGLAQADAHMAGAVIDLQLGNDSGLALVPQLRALSAAMRILMLTGYASIDTAVQAIKLGADNYLTKPATADAIVAALGCRATNAWAPVRAAPLPLGRVQSEHIRRVLADHGGSISGAARALKMHRRTLQRKLARFS